jgi:hypothetical protein
MMDEHARSTKGTGQETSGVIHFPHCALVFCLLAMQEDDQVQSILSSRLLCIAHETFSDDGGQWCVVVSDTQLAERARIRMVRACQAAGTA